MKRQVHFPSLVGLIITLAATVAALWGAGVRYAAAPTIHQAARPRAWVSDFGDMATAIVLLAAPLVIWLAHKAFFSTFRR
jgi:hypothetical protein